MKAEFEKLLPTLVKAEVEFVLVGGVAGIVHGSARATFDVDFVYARSRANIDRLEKALAPHHPRLRDAPADLPFLWDARSIRNGLNFTLTTDLGDIDLFGEVAGGRKYEDLIADCIVVEAFGVRFQCVSLRGLIRLKEAAGRAKDREALAELRALEAESAKNPPRGR